MIIQLENGQRKRFEDFQTLKIKGKNKYVLIFKRRHKILLEYGGKLASNWGANMVTWKGEPIETYPVSFNKLPDNVKEQVRKCILTIQKEGTPMENDESIFNY